MKKPLCHFAAAAGMLLFAWACDSEQSVHPEISETDFRMPSHVLAGEMTAIYASAQLEDAVLYIGGREFPADSWWEDEEGRWGTWITVPDDFRGEYEVSAGYQDGDSESGPEIIGKIEVWQLSDEPYYSTRRPAYADIGGAVLIVNSCKVTRTGIERLVFRDADGTQVKAELSMETGISSGYSCGILEYCSDYDITYPSDGSYIAFREYGSEISEPVVIRNSDGLVVPLSVPDQGSLTGFYSVSETEFYFAYRDLTKPARKAVIDETMLPSSVDDIEEDFTENIRIRTEELRGSAGKLERTAGNIQLIATETGKVFLGEHYIYDGNTTLEMKSPSDNMGDIDNVFSLADNIITVKGRAGETRLYYAATGTESGTWHEFGKLDADILFSSVAVHDGIAYLFAADRYFTVDESLQVTSRDYLRPVDASEGVFNPGCPRTESWWYFLDKSGNLCRLNLEKASEDSHEVLGPAPQFMFHASNDTAVWNSYSGGKTIFYILSGDDPATVTDDDDLLGQAGLSFDVGAVTNSIY